MTGHTSWEEIKRRRFGSSLEARRAEFNVLWRWAQEFPECEALAAAYPRSYGLCILEPGHDGDHMTATGWPHHRQELVYWQ